ncbi:2,3-butanediol dehydrogenase [Neoactinobaculum massilliense]|uniref:2,3-butanediol dehydrogenase n=1 Tax=Neoactinobaculum massilliense TaxID=2364794 RepID=UPI000F53DC1C|nr:2,3-butanediol dehydrogenase [Neoactinobaculum massilliense]
MKAARYYGNHDIRIEDIEQQQLKPGTARIKIAWCGICGTDLHEYLDGPIFCPTPNTPSPVAHETAPVTLGYEMSGVISEVGDGIDDLKVGDHVVVEPYVLHDDVDTSENNDAYHLSKDMNFIGLTGRGGGLSENIVVRRRWIHKIPDSIPLDEAALIEPLSVAVHAVEQAGITGPTKGFALVGGAGPIGVLIASVLHAQGLTVAVTELSELRRKRALESAHVDYAFDPREVDVAAQVHELTDGNGADYMFEASSADPVLQTLIDAGAPRSVLVNASIWGHKPTVDLAQVVLKEITIRGTIAYVNTHPKTIDLVASGKINVKPFITGKINLEDLIDKGFDQLINHNETAVKVLVSPNGEGED